PLGENFSSRFSFKNRGEIEPANDVDQAAATTIEKLGLRHHTLTGLRREGILGALNPGSQKIGLSEARRLLAEIERSANALKNGANAKLRQFCFAIEPALR